MAAALGAGCGDDDQPRSDKEQIAAAITEFNRAFSRGDGEATCKLITEEYRNSIELGHGTSCERAVEQEAGPQGPEHEQVKALGKAEVVNVQIVETVATGDIVGPGLDSGPPAQAQRRDGSWLVSATAWGSL
jgi:hypothetical protein